jgi:mRNA interferase MazF
MTSEAEDSGVEVYDEIEEVYAMHALADPVLAGFGITRGMLSTTAYNRGDVALVNFVFADETGVRRRPVVVIGSDTYQRGRQEAIVAAITSNIDRLLAGDHLIGDWQSAGLLFPSVATGVIRTVKQSG